MRLPSHSPYHDIHLLTSHVKDETVDVLLTLKTPWVEEKELQSSLQRLMISLEARVINSPTPNRETSPPELIFAGAVADISDPFVVVEDEASSDSDSSDTSQYLYAIWKLAVPLARPRMRLYGPSIVMVASAGVKPEISADLASRTSGYLQSGVPSSLNLLESFSNDPALNGVKPRLSALRVSRVAPVTRQQDLLTKLRTLPQLQLPVFPVVHSRIRFSRPTTAPPTATLIAILEFDFTPDFDCEVLLDKIDLSTPSGTVTGLSDDPAMKLPLSCVSHDHISLLYEVKPHAVEYACKELGGTLDISISATIQVAPGVCTPRIDMAWTATLDFSTPVNPSFGQNTDTGIQRAHRPAQLSLASAQSAITSLKSPSVIQPDALPALEASATHTEAAIPDLGITMSFSAPTETIRPGDVFSWSVYVLNRSTEKSGRPPRKLALIAVPRRRRHENRSVRPPSTASRRQGEKEIADAVVDDNVLHAMQKNGAVDGVDVVSLSPDTRVGPLGPGACHVVELQFLALRPGVAGVEAIRVVDLGSQEHVDIRDLPTTIIEPLAA